MKRVLLSAILVSLLILGISPPLVVRADTDGPTGTYDSEFDGSELATGSVPMNVPISGGDGTLTATVILNGTSTANGVSGVSYFVADNKFNMTWDTTKVANGNYAFKVELSDGAHTGLIKTGSGKDTINFVVSNTAQATTPSATPTTQSKALSTCKIGQTEIDKTLKDIHTRMDKQLQLLDKTYEKLEDKIGTEKSDETLEWAKKLQETAGDSVDSLKEQKIDCTKDPKTDFETYRTLYGDVLQNLVSYREELQKVIEEVDA